MIFAPLYSDKRNSRPNAPVNVIVGALILKELMDLRMTRLLKSVSLISDIVRSSYNQLWKPAFE